MNDGEQKLISRLRNALAPRMELSTSIIIEDQDSFVAIF
jgi:hypothetical protein